MREAGGSRGAADLNQQLRSAIRKMEVALGAIGDSIVWSDADGAIEWCNETFERAIGRPRITLLGLPVVEVLAFERAGVPVAQDAHPVAIAARDGSSPGTLFEWQGRILEVSATRCRIGDASPTVVVAMREMTERVALQEEVERKTVELEAQNARLRIADRMKSDFLANMSHELRTPLNAIIGFAELLADGSAAGLSPKQRTYIGNILTSGKHLLSLITDMLAFADVASGGPAREGARVEPAAIIAEVLDSLRDVTERERLHIRVEVAPSVGEFHGDAAQLRQIIHVFVSNAVKFTPSGGSVTIRVRPEDAAHFRVEVVDTGPGIAAQDLGRLFVQFEQLDSGVAKHHQGTGLGLALAKRIAEAQGGTVGVASAPGRGSTFHAVLRRHGTRAEMGAEGVRRAG